MKTIKLIRHKKLVGDKYKYEFVFLVDSNIIKTKFGASGYSDYTIHKDIHRRNRYINRHWKDLNTNDPTRAGYLSMYILWNFPTYEESLKDYKERLSIFNEKGIFPLDINNHPQTYGLMSFGYFAAAAKLIAPSVIKFGKDMIKEVGKEAAIITAELTREQIDKQVSKLKKNKKCKDGDKDCAEFGSIPKDVLNKNLYQSIKNKLKNNIKGRRWGVYDSARLIKQYKEQGGKYSKTKKIFGTDRWFKEKWIDACAWTSGNIVQCGRTNSTKQKIRYCRPLYRITNKTPKTVNEIGKNKVLKLCQQKMNNSDSRVFA